MSSANGGASGSGQAPSQPSQQQNSGNSQGQAPQANNNGGSGTPAPNAGQQPQAGSGNTTGNDGSGQQQSWSQADYERVIRELRQENAGHRTENARVAAELKKLQDAGLSAEQKRDRDFAEMQARNLEYELRFQQQGLALAGYRLGASLGIGDVGAALALVQSEHGHEVKYAADGTPENIADLLKKVLQDHPILAASQQTQQSGASAGQQQRPGAGGASSGGATNPGAGARTGTFTREQIAKMTLAEYQQHQAAIFEALKQGQIR